MYLYISLAFCGSDRPAILDHAPWLLGQGYITLAKLLLVRMACNLGVWVQNPPAATCHTYKYIFETLFTRADALGKDFSDELFKTFCILFWVNRWNFSSSLQNKNKKQS